MFSLVYKWPKESINNIIIIKQPTSFHLQLLCEQHPLILAYAMHIETTSYNMSKSQGGIKLRAFCFSEKRLKIRNLVSEFCQSQIQNTNWKTKWCIDRVWCYIQLQISTRGLRTDTLKIRKKYHLCAHLGAAIMYLWFVLKWVICYQYDPQHGNADRGGAY